jgi:hypothetical protein
MLRLLVLGMLFALPAISSRTAFAQPQPVLHCYGVETQIGIVARRDYFDESGLVVKEVLYRSSERTGRRTCAEDTLRIYSIKNITRDALGRSIVETELSANGEVERVLRHEYLGDSKDASRDIWSAPDGTRRYEIRRGAPGNATQLYYDGGLVVGVMGPPPTDVSYAVRWGTEVDGWSCGIAVAKGSVYVHLKNGTQKETSAGFVDWFATELHDARGALVPVLPAYTAANAARPKTRGIGRLVGPHEAAYSAYELEPRYGRLLPGHYSLAVWHPHPITGVMVRSNTFEFDVPR